MKKYLIGLVVSGLLVTANVFAADSNTININTATAQQLTTVKGIGPKRAAAIIAFREQHGQFKSVQELTGVKGLSPKLLARWQKDDTTQLAVK